MSEIAKWYSGKNILVTGATGFVGKCIVEKLLRDCPDVGNVYIIIRNKCGDDFERRKRDYTKHIVFDHLNEHRASALDKIKIVEGDLEAAQLGMSASDRKLIADSVSIVFHSAADVRFDRPMRIAYDINMRGTKRMLDFAAEFKHLDAFVFVSTAFSQTHGMMLEERHYESTFEPELMEHIIDKIDPDQLDALSPKILGKYPNTYGFTKGLCEQLAYEYKDKFPIAIARPTIIIASWREPLAGFTEGLHGINGWCLAVGRGVLRSMYCQPNYPCNVIPADLVVNGLILLAYERGKNMLSTEPCYFNIAQSIGKTLSWSQSLEALKPNFFKSPYDYALWLPGGTFKSSRLHNFLCVLLFQILPALLIDFIATIARYDPFMLHVQRKIQDGCDALRYYMNQNFRFKTARYDSTFERLNDEDQRIFYNRSKMDIQQYFSVATLGSKLYLIKDKKENMPKAHQFMRRLYYLDLSVKILIGIWIVYKILKYLEPSWFL